MAPSRRWQGVSSLKAASHPPASAAVTASPSSKDKLVLWCWETDDGSWQPFDSAADATTERAYSAREGSTTFTVGSSIYFVDFATLEQKNVLTGASRRVRRGWPGHDVARLNSKEDKLFGKVMGVDAECKKEIAILRGPTEVSFAYNSPFTSQFHPKDMRCLALVAHNYMKPAMKDFVRAHGEVLKKFRLTGTNTTVEMLKTVFGDDPSVEYGPSLSSGPLGGDAELCNLMCQGDLGGMLFFIDPMSAHPHQADIDSLVRLANVHNILLCTNPATAHGMVFLLKCALEQGRKDKMPSFFYTLESPGVKVYKEEQKKALESNTAKGS